VYFKFLGCILIVVGSSLIGFYFGENLRKRVLQLKEIEQALYQLQSEIIYTHSALPDTLHNISKKCTRPISNIFSEVSNLLYENKVDSVHDGFEKIIEENKGNLNLKQYDIDVLMDLSKSLGESNIEGQKSIMTLTIKNIRSQIDDAELAMKNNVKMYRYLGFSFGAIVVIMIL
jgi:stage III sporulation protein AB